MYQARDGGKGVEESMSAGVSLSRLHRATGKQSFNRSLTLLRLRRWSYSGERQKGTWSDQWCRLKHHFDSDPISVR